MASTAMINATKRPLYIRKFKLSHVTNTDPDETIQYIHEISD